MVRHKVTGFRVTKLALVSQVTKHACPRCARSSIQALMLKVFKKADADGSGQLNRWDWCRYSHACPLPVVNGPHLHSRNSVLHSNPIPPGSPPAAIATSYPPAPAPFFNCFYA